MANMLIMPRGLKVLFLRCVFLGELPPPFFIGLSTKQFEFEPTMESLLDAELTSAAIGYQRILISPKDWMFSIEPLGVTTQSPIFRNTGDERWPSVLTWFITTSFSGFGEVIMTDKLRESKTLTNLDSLLIPLEFQYPG